MKRRRIVLIGPMPPPSGGVSTHLSRLLNCSAELNDLQVSVFDIRRLRLHSKAVRTRNIILILSELMLADVVHVHISRKLKLFLMNCLKAFGKKVIYTHHNSRNLSDPLTHRTMEKADLVILVRAANPTLPEHIHQKCKIVPAYIPPFATEPLTKDLLEIFSSGKILFAHCYQKKTEALLIDGKDLYGFDLIFEALELIDQKLPTSGLVLFLADPADAMKEFYQEKVREVTERTGVRIVYWTKEFDFSSALAFCTLLIRATRSDGDAISVREALHAGVPVLASDCVERPEGVRTFFSGDSTSLAENLLEILNNPKPQLISQKDYSTEIFNIYRTI